MLNEAGIVKASLILCEKKALKSESYCINWFITECKSFQREHRKKSWKAWGLLSYVFCNSACVGAITDKWVQMYNSVTVPSCLSSRCRRISWSLAAFKHIWAFCLSASNLGLFSVLMKTAMHCGPRLPRLINSTCRGVQNFSSVRISLKNCLIQRGALEDGHFRNA